MNWQPIETAPRFKPVLLCWRHWDAKRPIIGELGLTGWWSIDALYDDPNIQPSHWMELPELPPP